MFGEEGAKEPESFFLTTSTDHEDKSNDKVHRLAVADVFIVDSVGLKDVPEGFLADTAALRNGEKGM